MDYDCDLSFWGPVARADLERLYHSVFNPFSYRLEDFIQAVEDNEILYFHSVTEAEMVGFRTALLRSGMGFRLVWWIGRSKDTHCIIWDPAHNEHHRFEVINGRLFAPVDAIECPNLRAQTLRGRDLYTNAPTALTHVYDSAHELIEAIGSGSAP
tara:strand:- start:504 stop:968 length:465 start_codon:yes stop_codon:yes gene_type:complete